MARQIDTISIYLHIRRKDDGSYTREIQRVSAVATDPNPQKSADKQPLIVENHDFGVAFDEKATVKKLLDDITAAVGGATDLPIYTDTVINRTTFAYLANVNKDQYDSKDWLINPDLSGVAGVLQKYWKVVADTVVEMDDSEKTVVDANGLQVAIDSMVAVWTGSINKFISSNYNLGQQQTLQTCWIESIVKGWTNRGAMVQKVWDWVQTCLDYFYAQRQKMWDATTIDDLNKVEKDLSQFEATNPKIITEDVDKTTN